MEHDERDRLVSALVLETGRLMEDLTPDLAMVVPADPTARLARLSAFQQCSEECAALLKAAQILSGQS